jgi:hypothetical protein
MPPVKNGLANVVNSDLTNIFWLLGLEKSAGIIKLCSSNFNDHYEHLYSALINFPLIAHNKSPNSRLLA